MPQQNMEIPIAAVDGGCCVSTAAGGGGAAAAAAATTTTGTISHPPVFSPQATDKFAPPQPNSLVSYIWAKKPKLYRTGLLLEHPKDTIRFYLAKDDIQEYKFCLTEPYFEKGSFRCRTDLQPGR